MLALILTLPSSALARAFDYLHVEADSGASSGGHAAIRFGDDTYHFVNADPGIVRAVRESSDEFEFAYRAYDNRAIDVTRVDVSDPAYERLRRAFVGRVLVEDAHLDVLDSARSDQALLADLLAWSASSARTQRARSTSVVLKGAGYFFGGGPAKPAREGTWAATVDRVGLSAMQIVRTDVEHSLGRGWIERQAAELDRRIADLRYPCAPGAPFQADHLPAAAADFARRYRDLLLVRLALDVLSGDRTPVPEAFRTSPRAAFALDAAELEGMRVRAAVARTAVATLLVSTRTDRGFPLLVAMARLVAMQASLETGRLVVLDTFVDDGETISPEELRGDASAVNAVLDEKRTDLEAEKRAVARARPADEAAYTRLELAANFYLELERGLTTGAPIRVNPAPVPSRPAAIDPAWPHPVADPATLARWGTCARDVARADESYVRRLYGYDLLSRNCVTEIFATIDTAFLPSGHDAASTTAEQRRVLGGRVDGEQGFHFIPFVAADAVNATYHVARRERMPSYRHYWLERLLATDPSITTRIRESNTLTSRVYQGDGSDVFLFFTDDVVAMRPILGAANLIVGTGAAAAGLVSLPFDRGHLVLGGLRGMLFSVPELAFVNLRKGSNAIVPRDWMQRPPFDPRVLARGSASVTSR